MLVDETPGEVRQIFEKENSVPLNITFIPAVYNLVSLIVILILCIGLIVGSGSYLPILFSQQLSPEEYNEAIRNVLIGFPHGPLLVIWVIWRRLRRSKQLNSGNWKYGLFLIGDYFLLRKIGKKNCLCLHRKEIKSFYLVEGISSRTKNIYIYIQTGSQRDKKDDYYLDLSELPMGIDVVQNVLPLLEGWKDGRDAPPKGTITIL